MSLLSALATGASLLSGLGQSNQSNAASDEAMRIRRQELERLQLYDQQRVAMAHELQRSGYGDPAARLAALERAYGTAQGISMGNAALAGRVAGYRPGDTAPLEAMRGLSQQGQAQYAQQALNAQEQAMRDKWALWSQAYSPSTTGAGMNVASAQDHRAQSLAPNMAGLVAGLGTLNFDFLKARHKAANPGFDYGY